MGDRAPLVALLFDDSALSGHLRDALVEQGATIVYESDLRAFAPAELVGSSADVVVVDLDDPSDDDLDRLYDTVEGGHPRLVFNDADVSRTLEGWDRARWARHLAAKLVGVSPMDPPRPEDARAIEPRVVAMAGVAAPAEETFNEPLVDDLAITGTHGYPEEPMASIDKPAPVSMDAVPGVEHDVPDELAFSTTLSATGEHDGEGADPTELAAELEALLADTDASAISTDGLDEVPSAPVELTELASLDLSGFEVIDETPPPPPAPEREFDLSQFSLASEDDALPGTAQAGTPKLEIEGRATEYVPPPAPEWDLIDHDAVVPETVARPPASEFGIETLTAAEHLAQDIVDDGTHGIEAGFTLELVSMEEAIAPRTDGEFSHEMFLEGSSRAVRRVIALGGAGESEASIAAFLAAVPARLPAVLLVVAHHDDTQAFARRLGDLRIAGEQDHTAHGERLVVPRGSHVQIRRDGSVTVREDASATGSAGPSIDGVLSTLAGGFGGDALAIVFAGRGNDAVAGAQAVYDAGGRVWVESVPVEEAHGHMVAGIREERVAAYAGDVAALAQKLIEEFP
ncbi:MAG: chemotaxis protein CheB [Luteibacter sp.]|uniref:chemotaxis protein CheB n=1 Tax=Luteibacter sp. TaxID=1886636 RepID=UPI002806DE95|nr:chemotaxis protein CheB [Luteibacter sp.]MDQ7997070.1 chemotaxis protein CheB [Luteibacter sp.]